METKKPTLKPIVVYDMYGNPYVVRPSRLDALPFAVKAGIVLAVLLIFLNVEKDIGKKQAEIAARREK